MFARLVGSGGRLVVTTDPATRAVIADAKQVNQAVINLVLNARDAIAPDGRVEVAVGPVRLSKPLPHALSMAPAGDYVRVRVRVRVRDDGCGMRPDTVTSVFHPFYTTKGRSAGLGLTIVAGVARKANAAVNVESSPGTGPTVDLYYPRIAGS